MTASTDQPDDQNNLEQQVAAFLAKREQKLAKRAQRIAAGDTKLAELVKTHNIALVPMKDWDGDEQAANAYNKALWELVEYEVELDNKENTGLSETPTGDCK